MSGKLIKIAGVIGVFALAVLGAGPAPVQQSNDPCGGHYVGDGLKGHFSTQYMEAGILYQSAITNDIESYDYAYRIPDGDCVFYFREGHIGLAVEKLRNGRYVNIRFDGEKKTTTGAACAPNPYFLSDDLGINGDRAKRFFFRTTGGFTWFRDSQGKLILRPMYDNLDFEAMTPGQTAYCYITSNFTIMDVSTTPYDESVDVYDIELHPVKVEYGLVDGTLKWVIRPIAEPYTIRIETKVKKTVVVTETSFSDSMWRTVISNHRTNCVHGLFYFPFELILEKL